MPVELLTAQDANWNLERGAFNVLIDQQPAGIALPRSANDVSDVVRAAAADGRQVAAQCTGHLAAPLGPLTDTVLLRTASLDGVEIDADAGTARVGAGAPSGAIWYRGHPSWVSLPCMARPRALALWVTRLVAASASTLASTGWLPIG